MGGAEIPGPGQLPVVEVDGDDGSGTGQPGAGDRRVADPAAADHRDRVVPPDAAGVQHGAQAGHHPQPSRSGDAGRIRASTLVHWPALHQGLLDERADCRGRD